MRRSFIGQIILVSFFLAISLRGTAGGGWPQPKQSGFLKISQYWIVANHFFNADKTIIDIPTTGFFSAAFYGEYGISDKLTGIINMPLFVHTYTTYNEMSMGMVRQTRDQLNSVGDLDLGLKYGLFVKNGFAGALQLNLGIPTGTVAGGGSGLLQSGDGEFNQMLSVHLSHSFGTGNIYSTAYAGFNNRTNNFSDELRWGLEAGIRANSFWLIGRLYAVHSLMNGTVADFSRAGLFNNNTEYVALSPEVSYNITKKMGIAVSAGFAFSGSLLLADPSYSAGVFWQF